MSVFLLGCKDDPKKNEQPVKSQSEEKPTEKQKILPEKKAEKQISQEPLLSLPGVEKIDGKTVVASSKDGLKICLEEIIPDLLKLPKEVLADKQKVSEILKTLLSVQMKMKILSIEAQKENIEKDPKVIEATKEIPALLSQQHLLEEAVKERVKESELREKFEELKKSLPKEDEISLRILECKSKEEAFQKLKNISSLTSDIKTKGRLLPWLRKAQLPIKSGNGFASIEDIFRATKGTIVKLPIDFGQNKFAIVYVESKRAYDPVSYEDAKGLILQQFFFYQKVSEYIKELSERYGVKKFTPNGKPLTQDSVNETFDLKAAKDDQVIVEFENTKVSWKTLKEMVPEKELQEVVKPENYSKILDSLITKPLLAKETAKQNLQNNPEVKAKIHKTTIAIQNKMYIDSQVKVTPQDVKSRYDEEMKILPKNSKQIRLRWIVMSDKEKAEEVLKKIKSGGADAFSQAAKEHSLDAQTREKGGDLGYKVKREIGDDILWNFIEKQANGTVLSKIYEMSDKYIIIRVEDKKTMKAPTFQEAKKDIEKQLYQEKAKNFVNKHYENYEVKLFNYDGAPLKNEQVTKKDLEIAVKEVATQNSPSVPKKTMIKTKTEETDDEDESE
jgi:parvulin-like peptidyl-prolyl isomerase